LRKKKNAFLIKVILVVTLTKFNVDQLGFLLSHDDWISLPKAHDYKSKKKSSVEQRGPIGSPIHVAARSDQAVSYSLHSYTISQVYINIFIFQRIATFVVERIRLFLFFRKTDVPTTIPIRHTYEISVWFSLRIFFTIFNGMIVRINDVKKRLLNGLIFTKS